MDEIVTIRKGNDLELLKNNVIKSLSKISIGMIKKVGISLDNLTSKGKMLFQEF